MKRPAVSTWATIDGGCSISWSVGGSDLANLMIGDNQLELHFDAEALRTLVTLGTAALAEMDARYEQEETERAAREEHAPVEQI